MALSFFPAVYDSKCTIKISMENSVTGKQNAVMCLLVAGVLGGIFTHAVKACQTTDDGTRNDSK